MCVNPGTCAGPGTTSGVICVNPGTSTGPRIPSSVVTTPTLCLSQGVFADFHCKCWASWHRATVDSLGFFHLPQQLQDDRVYNIWLLCRSERLERKSSIYSAR